MLFGGGVGADGGGGMKHITHAVCGCCEGRGPESGVESLSTCTGPRSKAGITGVTSGGNRGEPNWRRRQSIAPAIGSPPPIGAPARMGTLPCSGPAPGKGSPPCSVPVPSERSGTLRRSIPLQRIAVLEGHCLELGAGAARRPAPGHHAGAIRPKSGTPTSDQMRRPISRQRFSKGVPVNSWLPWIWGRRQLITYLAERAQKLGETRLRQPAGRGLDDGARQKKAPVAGGGLVVGEEC